MRLVIAFVLGLSFICEAHFDRSDSIRGGLSEERLCFDVQHYDLRIQFNLEDSSIIGSNVISFKVLANTKRIQLDLFERFQIDSVANEHGLLKYDRDGNAFFVELDSVLQKGQDAHVQVFYSGKPQVAIHAPWEGGFSWSKDKKDRPFIGVSCEGLGASSWWPNKDHLSDKPDSMSLEYIVPSDLVCVGNGKQGTVTAIDSNWNAFHWSIQYPIVNYNVTFYIGTLKEFQDYYVSGKDSLLLSYFVLDYNVEKAKKHFQQVKPMLKIYEELFGKYPFWNDGYKLVEAPYLGMEHQSGIAYGNDFKMGYKGFQMKGVDFDYVIIHESGHEYWGNSITMKDLADMWIHEAFCTYTEALYVEKVYGYEMMERYIVNGARRIANDKAIVGHYHVNDMGSSDMYMKGSALLHVVRTKLNNDSLWFATLKKMQKYFALGSVSGEELLSWLEIHIGGDLVMFLRNYLTSDDVPTLVIKKGEESKSYVFTWENEPVGFELNIGVQGRKRMKSLLVGNDSVIESFNTRRLKRIVPLNKYKLYKVRYE